MENIFNKDEIAKNCDEFFNMYDITKGRIRDMCKLKMIHTHAVAANCVYLAQQMHWSEYDCDLAWVIGELHDFARFGQAVVTKTFRDSDLYNHARLGVRLLFHHKMIKDIMPNFDELPDADKAVMEKAIYYHSDMKLPADLTERELNFCKIIREADQIDIFRTIVTSGWQAIYGHSKEEILSSDISDGILATFPKHELADYKLRVTLADYHIAHIALAFGLRSAAAIRRTIEQGYLPKMMDIEFFDPKVQEKYERAKICVEEFFASQK